MSKIYQILLVSSIVLMWHQQSMANPIKPGEIAKTKCMDYSKFVYNEELSPTLHITSRTESISKCNIIEVPLIIGGTKAELREFPHMAIIGFGHNPNENIDSYSWSCGGTIISERFVLTAAHCLKHRERGDAQRIRAGLIHLKTDVDHLQNIGISDRIPHPDYSAKSKYNDIALLKLNENIEFNEYVRPACLNFDNNFEWTMALATGFGRLAYESDDGSPDLMKVQLSNIEGELCENTYKSYRAMINGVQDSQFCAGEIAGKKDTCQGDSGGPLQTVLETPYCMYNIIGVTSFGKFCGFENSPGIYTKVSYFIDWIEKNVWS